MGDVIPHQYIFIPPLLQWTIGCNRVTIRYYGLSQKSDLKWLTDFIFGHFFILYMKLVILLCYRTLLTFLRKYKMKTYPGKIVFILLSTSLLISNLSGCSKNEPNWITPEYQKIISMAPEIRIDESALKDPPPEEIAVTLVNFLEQSNIDNAVKSCAALDRINELGEESKCYNEYAEDVECAIKEGFWKDRLRHHLASQETDLNADNIPDYIVSGDHCAGLSHVYTSEYFVLLSQKDKTYHVALSTNANYLYVLPITKNNAKMIVEGINSYNGSGADVWHLQGKNYIHEACFYRPNKEQEVPYERVKCYEPKL